MPTSKKTDLLRINQGERLCKWPSGATRQQSTAVGLP